MYLLKINGFNTKEFQEDYYNFMDKERLAYVLALKILEYANKTQHVSKGMFAQFLVDIFDDDEILKYCEDDILTKEQLEIKKDWLK